MTIPTDGNRRLLNRTGAIVAIVLMVMFGFSLYILVRFTVPEGNQNAFMFILGSLCGNVTAVVSYFFGSSVSVSRQGEIISTQADTIKSAQDKLAPVAGAPDTTVNLSAGDTVAVKAEDPK